MDDDDRTPFVCSKPGCDDWPSRPPQRSEDGGLLCPPCAFDEFNGVCRGCGDDIDNHVKAYAAHGFGILCIDCFANGVTYPVDAMGVQRS